MRFLSVALTVSVAVGPAFGSPLAAQQRPLTFMDVQELNRAGSWTPSPDGAWMLYTVTTPDWEAAESQTDIHLVSLGEGVASSRQLTYTDDRNETSPAWAPDGSFFVFSSNRDGNENQLYMMRHDGGEARKVTDAAEGGFGLRVQPGRELAGLPLRRERSGAAPPAAGRRPCGGRARAAHRRRGRGRPVGLHPGREPHLLRAPRLVRRGRGEAARDGLHGRRAQRRHPALEPVERGCRVGDRAARDRRRLLQRQQLHALRRWPLDRHHGRLARALRAQHHRAAALRGSLSQGSRDRRDRAPHRQLRDRRGRDELLARRPLDRLLGAGRHGALLDDREPRLHPRSG